MLDGKCELSSYTQINVVSYYFVVFLTFHNHKLPDITLKMTTIKNYCVVRILFYIFVQLKQNALASVIIITLYYECNDKMLIFFSNLN